MNPQQFSQPAQLERNSFLWSQVRLGLAALALFMGGVPPLYYFIGGSGVWNLLKIAWLISGVASVYLLYRWNANGQRVFGGKNQKDTAAFLVSVVSGINLGLTGLLGQNIGMSLSSSRPIFVIVGVVYVASAVHLHRRWKMYGEKVF